MKKIFWEWFWRIMVLIITLLLLSINSNQQCIMVNQDDIKTMQTDTLNTLNDMQLDQNGQNPDAISEALPEQPAVHQSLTADERDLIERVVATETRGEDMQAQMAVAQTILDRSRDWSMPITDVVNQTGVYDSSYQGDISDSVKLAVANVFDGGVRVFEGGTYQFHDNTVNPSWTEGKVDRGSIGNLRFYGGYEQ